MPFIEANTEFLLHVQIGFGLSCLRNMDPKLMFWTLHIANNCQGTGVNSLTGAVKLLNLHIPTLSSVIRIPMIRYEDAPLRTSFKEPNTPLDSLGSKKEHIGPPYNRLNPHRTLWSPLNTNDPNRLPPSSQNNVLSLGKLQDQMKSYLNLCSL